MRHWTGSSLLQVMTCPMVGAKPKADLQSIELVGANFSEILIDIQTFHWRICIWKCSMQMATILSQSQCVNNGDNKAPCCMSGLEHGRGHLVIGIDWPCKHRQYVKSVWWDAHVTMRNTSLKPDSCQNANFAVTSGTRSCDNGHRQWRQSWQHNNSFWGSVFSWNGKDHRNAKVVTIWDLSSFATREVVMA